MSVDVDVLRRPMEDRPGDEGSRVAVGRTEAGRYVRVIYVPDAVLDSVLVITAYQLGSKALRALRRRRRRNQLRYPAGWDAERVRRVLEHYETQSDEEAVAEDEAAYETTTHTAMEVPVELVPAVRELIAKGRAG